MSARGDIIKYELIIDQLLKGCVLVSVKILYENPMFGMREALLDCGRVVRMRLARGKESERASERAREIVGG